ncbi:hypothetical protein [Tolypothrix sp. VBCCA 56010]|uniref:hypothetical protein n=1 Tax=Tolypothrix sp. VBCCA 56010 TaxID=3137731 RepID=UPI003D7DE28E
MEVASKDKETRRQGDKETRRQGRQGGKGKGKRNKKLFPLPITHYLFHKDRSVGMSLVKCSGRKLKREHRSKSTRI